MNSTGQPASHLPQNPPHRQAQKKSWGGKRTGKKVRTLDAARHATKNKTEELVSSQVVTAAGAWSGTATET